MEPTICLTLPLWMSMQGRKAEGSAARALATSLVCRLRRRFLVEEEEEPLEKKLLLLLSRPLLLSVLMPLRSPEHAADRVCIGNQVNLANEQTKNERGQEEERKVKKMNEKNLFTPFF